MFEYFLDELQGPWLFSKIDLCFGYHEYEWSIYCKNYFLHTQRKLWFFDDGLSIYNALSTFDNLIKKIFQPHSTQLIHKLP